MAVRVYDKDNDAQVEVSSAEAQEGIASGRYKPLSGKVRVKRGNQTGSVDSSQIGAALANSWEVTDDAEAAKIRIRREESSIAGQAIGTAENVASGLTLGLSDLALTESGIADPERMAARSEALGDFATVAQVAGALAPALVTGGASAGASGASLAARGASLAARGGRAGIRALGAPVRAVEGLGVLAERGVARVAGEGLAGRSLGLGVRGGIEGIGGGIQQEIHESVLGEREITAERLMSAGFTGMVLGGGLGAALPGISHVAAGAARAPVGAMKRVMAGMTEGSDGSFDGLAKMMSAAGGKRGDAIGKQLQYLGGGKEKRAFLHEAMFAPEEAATRSAAEIQKATDDLAGTVNEALTRSEGDIRRWHVSRMLDESHDLVAPQRAMKALADLDVRTVNMLEEAREFSGQLAVAPIQKAQGRIRKAVETVADSNSATDAFMELQKARREIQQMGRALKGADYMTGRTKEALGELSDHLGTQLKDRALFGKAADMFEETANADAMVFREAEGLFKADGTGKNMLGRILSRQEQTSLTDALAYAKKVGRPTNAAGEERADAFFQAQIRALETRAKYFDDDALKAEVKKAVAAHDAYKKTMLEQAERADLIEMGRLANQGGTLTGAITAFGPSGAAITGAVLGGPIGAAAGMALNVLARPQQSIRTLSAIMHLADQANGQIVDAIGATLGRIGKKSGTTAVSKSKPGKLRMLAIKSAAIGGTSALRDEKRTTIRERAPLLANSPDALEEALGNSMLDVGDVAPGLAAKMHEKLQAAAAYLSSVAPVPYEAPFAAEPLLDPVQERDFDDAIAAVVDPIGVLEGMPSGTVNAKHVEAIKAVYPEIYLDVQRQIMDEVLLAQAERRPMPLDMRSQLGILFDVQADVGLMPGMIAELAKIHASEPEQPEGPAPQKPRQARATTMKGLVSKTETVSQRLAGGGS
jgi:hypothetical protein